MFNLKILMFKLQVYRLHLIQPEKQHPFNAAAPIMVKI